MNIMGKCVGRFVAIAGALVLLVTTLESGHVRAVGGDAPPSIITSKSSPSKRTGYHVVKRGDTLWDLCADFFGKPWFWPTLWSYNPQITNPHWIYPGDLLLMKIPGGVKRTVVWNKSRYSEKPADVQVLARWLSFMPDDKDKASGTIAYAREEVGMLSEYDEVYVSFKKDTTVKRGQVFAIYRDEGEVMHPKTEEPVGRRTRMLGLARVLSAKNDYVKMLITRSYEEIKRGDKLATTIEHSWVVDPVTNEKELKGLIIDHNLPSRFSGQWQYVIVDKGTAVGVKVGNRFSVQRRGDGTDMGSKPVEVTDDEEEEQAKAKFPWENVGEIMIVKAFEKTSVGVVTRSIRELSRGERIVMKKGL